MARGVFEACLQLLVAGSHRDCRRAASETASRGRAGEGALNSGTMKTQAPLEVAFLTQYVTIHLVLLSRPNSTDQAPKWALENPILATKS